MKRAIIFILERLVSTLQVLEAVLTAYVKAQAR